MAELFFLPLFSSPVPCVIVRVLSPFLTLACHLDNVTRPVVAEVCLRHLVRILYSLLLLVSFVSVQGLDRVMYHAAKSRAHFLASLFS